MRWTVNNVSTRSIGAHGEVGRVLGARLLREGGELDDERAHHFDDAGLRAAAEVGDLRVVDSLDARGSVAFEGTLAVSHDASPYSSARFVLRCELGRLDAPGEARTVQFEEHVVRVGKPFLAGEADVLCVVNNRTTAPELAAWEAHGEALGLRMAVWDASLEGGLGVLSTEQTWKSVVLLDGPMDTPTGERKPISLMDQATLIGLARKGTHLLSVGRDPGFETRAMPSAERPDPTSYESSSELAAALASAEIGEGRSVELSRWYLWPWSNPRESELDRATFALDQRLQRDLPARRFVVHAEFSPKVTRTWLWARRVSLGTAHVQRATDPSRGALRALVLDPAQVHAEDTIRSSATFAVLVASLPFDAKLALLGRCTLPIAPPDAMDPLVAAVLADLSREQSGLSAIAWTGGAKALRDHLPMTSQLLGGSDPGSLDPESEPGKRVIELCAWLLLSARGHVRAWQWLPPFLWLSRGPKVRARVRAAAKALLARCFGESGAVRERVEARRRELRAAFVERRKSLLVVDDPRVHAAERAASPVAGRSVRSDADVLRSDERVLTTEGRDAVRAKAEERAKKARLMADRSAKARELLLCRESCEELLARQPKRVAAEAAPPPSALGDLDDLREDARPATMERQ